MNAKNPFEIDNPTTKNMNPEEAVAEIKRIIAKDFGIEKDQCMIEDLKEIEGPSRCAIAGTEVIYRPIYKFRLIAGDTVIGECTLNTPIEHGENDVHSRELPPKYMKQLLSTAAKNILREKKMAELEKKVHELSKENEALRLLPGAPEYFAAREHYESMTK